MLFFLFFFLFFFASPGFPLEVKLPFVSSSNVLHVRIESIEYTYGNERRMEIRIPYVYIYVRRERKDGELERSVP